MDLQDFSYLDSITRSVPHPRTGEPTTWKWTLAGPAHPATLAQAETTWRRQVERQAERQRAAAAAADAGQTYVPVDTLAQQRQDLADRLAPRVLGWTPVTINGGDFPYSPDAVRTLLSNAQFGAITAWLQLALGDGTNFLPVPAAPSSSTPPTSSASPDDPRAGAPNEST